MPTYDYICDKCGVFEATVQTIGEYSRAPIVPKCGECQASMRRYISVEGGYNHLAGDRYYDGLRAPDGADISTRSKHRQYMKANGVTLADDFKGQWKKQAKDREAFYTGKHKDPQLRETIAREVYRRFK